MVSTPRWVRAGAGQPRPQPPVGQAGWVAAARLPSAVAVAKTRCCYTVYIPAPQMVLVKVVTRTSSKVLDVDDSVIHSYQNGLRPTTRAEAGLLELLNSMFWDIATAPADALDEVVTRTRAITGFYRDRSGRLVVSRNDGDGARLSLLWPVRQPVPHRGPGVSIQGNCGNKAAFVVASGTVLPLAAVSDDRCDFDWGRADQLLPGARLRCDGRRRTSAATRVQRSTRVALRLDHAPAAAQGPHDRLVHAQASGGRRRAASACTSGGDRATPATRLSAAYRRASN